MPSCFSPAAKLVEHMDIRAVRWKHRVLPRRLAPLVISPTDRRSALAYAMKKIAVLTPHMQHAACLDKQPQGSDPWLIPEAWDRQQARASSRIRCNLDCPDSSLRDAACHKRCSKSLAGPA